MLMHGVVVKMMVAKGGETIGGGTRTIPAFVLDPGDISIFIYLRKYLPGILRERLQLRLGVWRITSYR